MESNFKHVICVRHGERCDYAGVPSKLHPKDPELTENGKNQARQIGEKLAKIYGDSKDDVIIMCSPFARTIQTAIEIHKCIFSNGEDKLDKFPNIFINNLLSEFIETSFDGLKPKDFLSYYTAENEFTHEISKFRFNNINNTDSLPELESDSECKERLTNAINDLVDSIISKNESVILILVSHGTPVDEMNQVLNYPGPHGCKKINFCDTFVYNYDQDNKSFEYVQKLSPDKI